MKVLVPCDNCLQITEKDIKKVKKYNFCSTKCKNEWNSKRFSEFNKHENPMNYPGRTIEERVEMRQRMLDFNQENNKEIKTYNKYLGEQEHRRIARLKLCRELFPNEVVHHIDGDIHNNKPNNLLVMTRSEHSRLHIKEYWESKNAKK